jgi:hypothetical protein
MRRRAIHMIPEGQRPQPRRIYRRGSGSHDAADHDAVGEHVVIVLAPFAGGTAAEASQLRFTNMVNEHTAQARLGQKR